MKNLNDAYNENLLIATPLFHPATGGAATYYNLFVRVLINAGLTGKIVVITEKYPGYPTEEVRLNGQLIIKRVFPFRSGNRREPCIQYIKYVVQNIQYLQIVHLINQFNISSVLVHSSFHNFPNILYFIMKILRYKKKLRLVADVRDWHMPSRRLYELLVYDYVVVCSENVALHLEKVEGLKNRTVKIPVMQEPIKLDRTSQIKTLYKYGLVGKRYIFYAGLIKSSKRVEVLVEAFQLMLGTDPDLLLVLAGIDKDLDWLGKYKSDKRIIYLGAVPRHEVIDLLYAAELNVNISPVEGMPRSSLEALATGRRVALPPNVPEFRLYCSEAVVEETTAKDISKKLLALCSSVPNVNYPLWQHYPNNVVRIYRKILFGGL